MNKIEQWRPVAGYEDIYDVSDMGRVRISNYRGTCRSKVMKCSVGGLGYRKLGLWKNKEQDDALVHCLVAAAFIGPRPDGFHVNHKNGNKLDNTFGNLEYCTAAENLHHAVRTGLMDNLGVKNGNAKLTEEKVKEIWIRVSLGEEQAAIARSLGVTPTQVWNILHRKSWARLAPAA